MRNAAVAAMAGRVAAVAAMRNQVPTDKLEHVCRFLLIFFRCQNPQ